MTAYAHSPQNGLDETGEQAREPSVDVPFAQGTWTRALAYSYFHRRELSGSAFGSGLIALIATI